MDGVIALSALELVAEAAAEDRVVAFVAPFVNAGIGGTFVYAKISHFTLHQLTGGPSAGVGEKLTVIFSCACFAGNRGFE